MKAGRLAVKKQPELLDEQPSPVAWNPVWKQIHKQENKTTKWNQPNKQKITTLKSTALPKQIKKFF